MEKIVGENVNWCRHDEKQYGGFAKKLKIELPYDPAILLLGMYLKTIKPPIWKDTWTPMSTAALFTTAKIWKQAKCPSIDEWIKKMWCVYIYTHIHTHTHTHAHTHNRILLCSKRRRQWQPAPAFPPGKFHGQRSLVGYSPWGRKGSDTTEHACMQQ